MVRGSSYPQRPGCLGALVARLRGVNNGDQPMKTIASSGVVGKRSAHVGPVHMNENLWLCTRVFRSEAGGCTHRPLARGWGGSVAVLRRFPGVGGWGSADGVAIRWGAWQKNAILAPGRGAGDRSEAAARVAIHISVSIGYGVVYKIRLYLCNLLFVYYKIRLHY